MSIFLDASAIVAMIAGEAEASRIAHRITDEPDMLVSGLARWEAVVALHRSHQLDLSEAQSRVDAFLASRSVRFVPIGETESKLAVGIYDAFGKGRSPPQLNMGDCFAAACSIANGAWLVHKGEDFKRTSLDWIDRA